MELKPMTREDFQTRYGKIIKSRPLGVKQLVVVEFLNSGAEVAEVENCGQDLDDFQVGILNAARSLKANVKCVIRRGHIFLIRLPSE